MKRNKKWKDRNREILKARLRPRKEGKQNEKLNRLYVHTLEKKQRLSYKNENVICREKLGGEKSPWMYSVDK